MSTKATLVLSGGGAKGAFQVGAERVLRTEGGYDWQRVYGVSVGALNGSIIAQHKQDRLAQVWNTLREDDVFHRFKGWRVALRLLGGKLGAFDNTPLRALIGRELDPNGFAVPFACGVVETRSGAYRSYSSAQPQTILDAVWASATMPLIWEPVRTLGGYSVDGGLRHITPIGEAIESGATEIVVILCSPRTIDVAGAPAQVLDMALRTLDILTHEIFVNDLREAERINRLVEQASAAGVTLTDGDGHPYRPVKLTVVEPAASLGDTLDFSHDSIVKRVAAGEKAAHGALHAATVVV